MNRILITGGLGFIGSNLTEYLLSKTEDYIVIYDNLSRENVIKNMDWLKEKFRGNSRLEIIKGDLRDFEKLKKSMLDVETIYHIAGQVAVTNSISDPITDFEINARGTLNVLESARQLNTDPTLILTSTNKVYGDLEEFKIIEREERYEFDNIKEGVPENSPLNPQSPYACSKYCADSYFKSYFRIYGLKTIVFRMSCIYGYRQFGMEDQGWVAHFIISSILNRKVTIFGNGKQVRDILFIQDLIDAFLLAIKNIKNTKGNVYNIGGGLHNTISLLELINTLEKLLNHKIKYDFSDWRPGDQKLYYSNIEKAKKAFNWGPQISKKVGIQKLFNWVRDNPSLF